MCAKHGFVACSLRILRQETMFHTFPTPIFALFLTSSSCHPKFFVKEFSDFLMSCHQHCLGVNLLVQR